MGGVTDILMIMLLLAGGYVLVKSGKLQEIMGGLQLPALPGLPAPAAPSGGGGAEAPSFPPAEPTPPGGEPEGEGGGGGGPPPAAGGGGSGGAPPGGGTASTGAGDCAKTIYAATGQVKDNSKRTKQGTRHYASGKPDDVTSEWGTSVNFKNYEFTAYFTITEVDHDDTVSFKFGGTHNGSGWYDCGIGFNNGQTCMGKEENHPSTDLCVVKGKSFGSILNKKIGLKCILVGAGGSGAELEVWCDPTASGNWQIGCPRQKGVGGFFPSSPEQECTIRIDAAPGITMHCSAIQEISGFTGGGGGGGGGAPAPAAPAGGGAPNPEPPAADSGGGGGEDSGGNGGGEDSGGGGSESNYASYYNRGYGRVNRRSYSSKVRYY